MMLKNIVMAKNTSFVLGDHFEIFIRKLIKSGRFTSSSEVVRAALRLLEQEEQQLKTLRDALVAGEQSGKPKTFDNEAFKRKMHRKYVKSDAEDKPVTVRRARS